jgi:hypothetical protein
LRKVPLAEKGGQKCKNTDANAFHVVHQIPSRFPIKCFRGDKEEKWKNASTNKTTSKGGGIGDFSRTDQITAGL